MGVIMTEKFSALGSFEELVLLAILNLDKEAYGSPIRRKLEEATEKTVSVGALYTTLDRLEEKGFISSRQGEATAERGNKVKRYYKVEGAGKAALKEAARVRSRVGITPVRRWA
jgi:DNA-binding PadR family transcriptional regulator